MRNQTLGNQTVRVIFEETVSHTPLNTKTRYPKTVCVIQFSYFNKKIEVISCREKFKANEVKLSLKEFELCKFEVLVLMEGNCLYTGYFFKNHYFVVMVVVKLQQNIFGNV